MRLRQAKKIWNQPWIVPVTHSIRIFSSSRNHLERAMRRLLKSSRHKRTVLDFITSQEDWVQSFSKAAAPMTESNEAKE
jgi:hypothetical protein